MVKLEEWMEIQSLYREGHSIKAIVRKTGRSRNTVRKVVRQKVPKPFQAVQRRSLLDPYKGYIETRFKECRLSCVRLFEEIEAMGYPGSIHTLRRFVRTLRNEVRKRQKLTVRFETPPGKQGQVDWAYCGHFPDANGQKVRLYAFVMVLSFSRMLYVELTRSMRLGELLRCHLRAFAYFGGWPSELLYDNMAQVRQVAGGLHPQFADFAHHHGIFVKTHRVRRPRTKGKVERSIRYFKDNFFNGRQFADLADAKAQSMHWLNHTANVRFHATTGERPVDLWRKESLTPVASVAPYRLYEPVSRKVSWEGFVQFARSRYSVPPDYAGRRVLVGCKGRTVRIHTRDTLIAEHRAATAPGECVADPQHIEQMWKLSVEREDGRVPRWTLGPDVGVEHRQLSAYEDILQ